MTTRSRRTTVRRLWPQRIRTRLAIFYSALLLAAGLGLVALAYTGALALTTGPPRLTQLTPSQHALLGLCKPLPSSKQLRAECARLLALAGPTQNAALLDAIRIAGIMAVVLVTVGAVALGWLAAWRSQGPTTSSSSWRTRST
jgi:hypothetical protein